MTELRVLGALDLKGSDGARVLSVLSQPKRVAVLCYLVLAAPGALLSRDRLLALFWPDSDGPHARNALSQILHALRRSLGHHVILTRGNHEVGISPAHLVCDALVFQNAARSDEPKAAFEAYSGPLLPGFHLRGAAGFQRWLDEERERLKEMAAQSAWAAAHLSLHAGELTEAERTAQGALALVCTDENEVRRFIEALARAGDRAAALRFYEKFCRRLEEELEVEASPETKAVVASISAQAEPTSQAASERSGGPAPRGTLVDGSSYTQPSPRPGVAWPVTAALVLGLVLALTALYLGLLRNRSPTVVPNRVLVSVFENQTGESSLDPIGRLAAERIIAGLSATGLVEVTPLHTALLLRNRAETGSRSQTAEPLYEMATETGAGIVISGSYFARGDSVVVLSRITDTRRSSVVRALEPMALASSDPGPGVADLANRLTAWVAFHLDPRARAVASDMAPPPSFVAYREFAAGLDAFSSRDWRRALAHFRHATEIDSAYLAPILKSVATHRNLGQHWQADSLLRTVEAWSDRASPMERESINLLRALIDGDRVAAYRAASRRVEIALSEGAHLQLAIEARRTNRPRETVMILADIDPEGPELSGWSFYWFEICQAYHMMGAYEEELENAERGRRQYPGDWSSLNREVRALAALGRGDEVLGLASQILDRWPDPSYLWGTASALKWHGQLDAAHEVLDTMLVRYEAGLAEDHAAGPYRRWYAEALYLRGRWGEALDIFEQLLSLGPDDVASLGYAGVSAARMGSPSRAAKISERLRNLDVPYLYGRHTFWRARIAAVLGELDEAVSLLHQAHAEGWSYSSGPLHSIDLEPLRGYPPFENFIRPKG